MYQNHFGLKTLPFGLTPNTSFFYASETHLDALNTLLFAIRSEEGFIKLTGEVGTGKTLLCRMLLNRLKAPYITAYVPNPYLNVNEFFAAIASELGVKVPQRGSAHEMVKRIERKLILLAQQKMRPVLIIDEAQALPTETIEAVRLISNLETEKRKLLQIVLFGQPELDRRLMTPELRQLRQRITFSSRLQPLSGKHSLDYIDYRLRCAGSQIDRLFSRPALMMLFAASGGTPRVLNILSHKALLAAFGRGEKRVRLKHAYKAFRDSEASSLWQSWVRRKG